MLRALDALGEAHLRMASMERNARRQSASVSPKPPGNVDEAGPSTPPPPGRRRRITGTSVIADEVSARKRAKQMEIAKPTRTPKTPSTLSAPATPDQPPHRRSRRQQQQHLAAATQQPGAPPTPESLPRRKPRRKTEVIVEIPLSTPSKSAKNVETVVAQNEKGQVEPVDKIHLLQERVRHDPWKLLVATSLLNVTSGRAARPVFWELLERWPTPQALSQASMPDLIDLLYPLGLFNQRASSLVRFSRQYLDLGWPLVSSSSAEHTPSDLPPLPLPVLLSQSDLPLSESPGSPLTPTSDASPSPPPASGQRPLPSALDVQIFVGAGVYASESFRIYSDLLPGRGGPEAEAKWMAKRRRAVERMGDRGVDAADKGVEDVGEWLSDEEPEEGRDAEEEWRKVRANDKELRRYLIWRWGLEGIVYDIHRGPQVVRERDKRRLGCL